MVHPAHQPLLEHGAAACRWCAISLFRLSLHTADSISMLCLWPRKHWEQAAATTQSCLGQQVPEHMPQRW